MMKTTAKPSTYFIQRLSDLEVQTTFISHWPAT